jgi:hypothetical protein
VSASELARQRGEPLSEGELHAIDKLLDPFVGHRRRNARATADDEAEAEES